MTEAEIEALTPLELRSRYRELRQLVQEIAASHTDHRLDEAMLFLRYRTKAQKACDSQDLDYIDHTFGGKSKA